MWIVRAKQKAAREKFTEADMLIWCGSEFVLPKNRRKIDQ
jgi:hypothetical protein